MKRLVAFSLPRGLTQEEIHYIGMSSLNTPFILTLDRRVVSVIKDYVIQRGQILFEISVEDERLEEILNSGDPDPNYVWIDPVTPMLGLVN